MSRLFKKTSSAALLIATLGSMATAHAAGTATTTLNFTGTVVGSCAFADTSKTIEFGDVDALLFTGVGTAPDGTSREFTTVVTCQGAGSPYYTLGSTIDTSDTTLIRNTGTATGVGIQLSTGGTVLQPNDTQRVTTTLTGNTVTTAWIARLKQTTTTIAAGTISATATLTLNFS
ncbi:fimbrial protein [Serratia quinivorans]|uniref:fimbrial protein n=1 Tax=Serratia quinivorans TaxID=137545 RepID=UPI00217A63F2|nr:fimbrial protein [Serratia quinivorans]CAI1073167.1 fimbrial chaperone protein [Serratia quinivorans]